jgi:hypothetical protein
LKISPELGGNRTWTDSTGKFRIEATFIRRDGEFVEICRADSLETIRLPLRKLSKADQELITKG